MPSLNLLYHRVNYLAPDPWELCVSPANFAQHLEVIKRLTPRPVITFDDGYADNLFSALPLLEAHDVSARFFITSGAIGRKTEMWWDALDLLYPDPDNYAREYDRLRDLSFHQQESELERLFAARSLTRAARPGRRMMTGEEVVRLSASPLAEIGAHTITHPILSQLAPEHQEQEIRGSKSHLENLVGMRVNGFSYPNGMDVDYTTETIQIVRRAQFTCAYSAFNHRRADAFQLPRLMIRNWNGDQFEASLTQRLTHRS